MLHKLELHAFVWYYIKLRGVILMGKTVLILGNGFDLAHGLPTRYSDFLKFCRATELLYTYSKKKMEKVLINVDPQYIH